MRVKIYPPAESRLLEIWDYTLEKWGEPQADAYIRDLINAMHALGDQRHLWRKLEDRKLKNIFFLRHQHHYIFFRLLSASEIGVISILHESMDLPARVREASKLTGEK